MLLGASTVPTVAVPRTSSSSEVGDGADGEDPANLKRSCAGARPLPHGESHPFQLHNATSRCPPSPLFLSDDFFKLALTLAPVLCIHLRLRYCCLSLFYLFPLRILRFATRQLRRNLIAPTDVSSRPTLYNAWPAHSDQHTQDCHGPSPVSRALTTD